MKSLYRVLICHLASSVTAVINKVQAETNENWEQTLSENRKAQKMLCSYSQVSFVLTDVGPRVNSSLGHIEIKLPVNCRLTALSIKYFDTRSNACAVFLHQCNLKKLKSTLQWLKKIFDHENINTSPRACKQEFSQGQHY